MKLIHRTIIRPNHKHYKELDNLCFLSKNLYNFINYRMRQYFFNTGFIENTFKITKEEKNSFDFKNLPAKVSQAIIIKLGDSWKSFKEATISYNRNPSRFKSKPKIPKYKDKIKGRNLVVYSPQAISKKQLVKNKILQLSKTNVKIPCPIHLDFIKEVRVVHKTGYISIEVIYDQEEVNLNLSKNNIASIDLGLNNLAALTSNVKNFIPKIINGRPLKSINQFFNKEKAKKQSKCTTSKAIQKLCAKRMFKIDDYLHKASRKIINHLIENNIGTLVIGKNEQWKDSIKIGKRNNQNFVCVPHNKFIHLLSYKAELIGIEVKIQEESFTSKSSFLDNDNIPSYKKGQKNNYKFSGRRIKRGIYRTSNKTLINADVNGSYNILRKAIPNAFANGIEGVLVHPINLFIKK